MKFTFNGKELQDTDTVGDAAVDGGDEIRAEIHFHHLKDIVPPLCVCFPECKEIC